MKIIKNTYPKYNNVVHGEVGDEVEWELFKGAFNLIRKKDKKTIFSTAPVNHDGLLRSNLKPPILIGIIGQVKTKRWILEIRK